MLNTLYNEKDVNWLLSIQYYFSLCAECSYDFEKHHAVKRGFLKKEPFNPRSNKTLNCAMR